MDAEQAVAIVRRERKRLGLGWKLQPVVAEKAIVEYTRDRQRPGVIEDRVAWIVELAGGARQARVHVDDRNGEILEVLRGG